MTKLQREFHTLAFLLVIILNCMCETVPEDLLTDNDEQLYKLQRDDLMDSIMDRIDPKTSEKADEKVETHESPQEEHNQIKKAAEEIAPLLSKSIFPSPSIFSSAFVDTIKIHTSNNISTPVINTTMETNKTIFESISSTQVLEKSALITQSLAIRNNETSSPSNRENISAIHPNTVTTTNSTSVQTLSQVLVSTMITSTTSLSLSTALEPHSISVVHETAPSEIQPMSTIFRVEQLLQSSSMTGTPMISTSKKASSTNGNIPTAPPTPSKLDSRKMPAIPDEHGYGGFIPTTLKNAKGIGFFYVNVLLPIIAGITGALFITFSILLFRCCRRRRLTKVRYFGAKNKRDIVHFDQMNLLTDTSDEDDFD